MSRRSHMDVNEWVELLPYNGAAMEKGRPRKRTGGGTMASLL